LEDAAILDEVQRCPELLVALKRNVDERRQPGRFILPGSANLALLGHVTEMLAGRASYFTLHPMTRREQRRMTDQQPFLAKFLSSPALPSGKFGGKSDHAFGVLQFMETSYYAPGRPAMKDAALRGVQTEVRVKCQRAPEGRLGAAAQLPPSVLFQCLLSL
jgi:hypothetical protein